MKKLFLLVAAMFAAVSFSACSDDDDNKIDPNQIAERGKLHVRSVMKLYQERAKWKRILHIRLTM